MEATPLIVELAVALVAATVGAVVAVRLGVSPIVGYIVAGIAIGPYTPGLVGDAEVVRSVADIGVVFLMFAIGAQVSLPDLARVGRLASIGGVVQTLVLLGAGYLVGLAIGLTPLEALFLGAVASNSSSMVLGKVLGDRGETETEHGHTALAWSTIQDLGTIVTIIVLSALATSPGTIAQELPLALAKATVFLVVVFVVGSRVVPSIVERMASLGSREVFLLGVAALALGTAYAATLFGISLAIGAFLAGVVVGQSGLASRVVGEALPFRDLFAGVFFVSIGMLVDPFLLIVDVGVALGVLLLIIALKGTVIALLARFLGRSWRSAILTGAVLAQCAEFSFLIARVGADSGALGDQAFSLILGASAVSVVLAPTVLSFAHRLGAWVDRRSAPGVVDPLPSDPGDAPWAVVCGFGRVGRVVGTTLEREHLRYHVIEEDRHIVDELRAKGVPTVRGSATSRVALQQADLANASVLVIAVPDPFTVRIVALEARALAPWVPIVARTHRAKERTALLQMGIDEVIVGETELGFEMTRFALIHLGLSLDATRSAIDDLRREDAGMAEAGGRGGRDDAPPPRHQRPGDGTLGGR